MGTRMKKIFFLITFIVLTACSNINTSVQRYNYNYFFPDSSSEINYKCVFSYEEGLSEATAMLSIVKLVEYDTGTLFRLTANYPSQMTTSRTNFSLFYVEQDKIYKLPNTYKYQYTSTENFRKDGKIVCSEQELEDKLPQNQSGFHEYISANGDIRKYCSYNNQTETGFFETFVWQKGVGLIFYESGYGAQRDYISLTIN